jgi:hypothetical protein
MSRKQGRRSVEQGSRLGWDATVEAGKRERDQFPACYASAPGHTYRGSTCAAAHSMGMRPRAIAAGHRQFGWCQSMQVVEVAA